MDSVEFRSSAGVPGELQVVAVGGGVDHVTFNPSEEGDSVDDNLEHRDESAPARTEDSKNLRSNAKQVFRLKIVILLALLVAAVFAALASYRLMHRQQHRLFHDSFHADSEKLMASFYRGRENKLWTGLSLSITATNFAEATDNRWPFVTLPKFALLARGGLSLAAAYGIAVAPIVTNDTRLEWEEYATENQHLLGLDGHVRIRPIAAGIFQIKDEATIGLEDSPDAELYLPIWQAAFSGTAQFRDYNSIMWNSLSDPIIDKAYETMIRTLTPVTAATVVYKSMSGKLVPRNTILFPILKSTEDKTIVGAIAISSDLGGYFENTLNQDSSLTVVTKNTCGQVLSFEVLGSDVTFLGEGDLHDPKFDETVTISTTQRAQLELKEVATEFKNYFADAAAPALLSSPYDGRDNDTIECSHTIAVYPTAAYHRQFETLWPLLFPMVCGVLFIVNFILFLGYDVLVKRRQVMVEQTAEDSNAIVNSLFPAEFRDRVILSNHQQQTKASHELPSPPHSILTKPKPWKSSSTLNNEQCDVMEVDTPIAELYQNTTVMFADIAGFTAWSSEREPAQVFQLLETLYRSFDDTAKRLGVFKVETIGDCYVCVTGLPLPKSDHAVVMARFAHECLLQMKQLTRALEVTLGPGTSELTLRIGMHSGSVIAGVLRGEKSRFQLFGDTMNVASRMESTGEKNLIQVSQETADLVVSAGKQHWLTARDEVIYAKGKGSLQTYWLQPRRRRSSMHSDDRSGADTGTTNSLEEYSDGDMYKISASVMLTSNQWVNTNIGHCNYSNEKSMDNRLVDWNSDILWSLLSKVIVSRNHDSLPSHISVSALQSPVIKAKANGRSGPSNDVIRQQLRSFVGKIASLYPANPFHNFEHASHVALSANKLLRRIVAQEKTRTTQESDGRDLLISSAYGISADPLLQFVIVFSALVHDLEHTGVPNAQLIKEKPDIASKYGKKSVAENHSVDLALLTLKDPQFKTLQTSIHPTFTDYLRFKELLVNAVLATDIVDKDLKVNRQQRWTEAFHGCTQQDQATTASTNEAKAAIVVEHIIQASDVAHTMQHWHVFCKWNERLYIEMLEAYRTGRSEKDPSEGWYESELGFFDYYIIPLAKKLEECGVFGVSSGEYLGYALQNRLEWEQKGRQVTEEMIARWKHGRRRSISFLQGEQDREFNLYSATEMS